MAFTVVGSSGFTVAGSSGADENKTLPGTEAENDIVIVALASDDAYGADVGLDGGGIETSDYTALHATTSGVPGRQAGWKRLTATPDSVVTISSHGALGAGLIRTWRGADTTTAIDNFTGSATGSSGDPDPPSRATVTDGAVRIVIGFLDDDDSTVSAAPTDFTGLHSQNTGGGSSTVGATVMSAYKVEATAGTVDPGAFTASGDDQWAAIHFALRPAAEGGEDALLANDVESDSEVSTPAIEQEHALNATDVQSTSNVTTPVIGQVHALSADDTESDSEVTAPILGQVHALTADDVESASEVSEPAAAQTNVLLADDVESASELTSPALGQVHALTADDVESASEVTAPNLGSNVVDLFAASVQSASEVSSPSLGIVGQTGATTAGGTPRRISRATQYFRKTLSELREEEKQRKELARLKKLAKRKVDQARKQGEDRPSYLLSLAETRIEQAKTPDWVTPEVTHALSLEILAAISEAFLYALLDAEEDEDLLLMAAA